MNLDIPILFILDWDVQESIVKAGNSGKYILKPVIRVNAEVNSGSIKGKTVGMPIVSNGSNDLIPLQDSKVSVYTTDDIYVTGTITDENGDFIIQGLNAGDYIVKIENLKYINFESESISVEVGETADMGSIELLVPVF